MNKKAWMKAAAMGLSCCIFLLTFLGVTVSAEDVIVEDEVNYADDTVIVVLDSSVGAVNRNWSEANFQDVDVDTVSDLTEVDEIHYELLASNTEFHQILELKLSAEATQTVEEAIEILSEDSRVLSATPNYYYDYHLVPNDYLYNDPETNLKTVYQLMGAESAWDITTGSHDVTVGVIDSGVYNHTDLGANLVSGWDFYNNNAETSDDLVDHGTHVAGIIGAIGNNSMGMVGVNSSVSIIPLQVAAQGNSVDSTAVIKAVLYACLNEIDIINCSFGGNQEDPALYRAMKMYKGLIVCSAGNTGRNIDVDEWYKSYPACFDLPNIISVAASTETDTLASYSTYGPRSVDLAAPGHNIISTAPGGYTKMSGTSMAAPFVAGTAALLLSYNPNLNACEVKDIILASVDKLDSLSGKVACAGRLNIYNALQSTLQGNYRRNITAKLSFDTNDLIQSLYIVVYYNANRLDLHSVVFDETIRGNAVFDYSVDGQIEIRLVVNEGITLSENLVRCNFITRQKFTLADGDIAVRFMEAKNSNNQNVSVEVGDMQALLGDINYDNEINMADSNQLYQVASAALAITEQERLAIDVNCDGIINMMDVSEHLAYVNGNMTSFF